MLLECTRHGQSSRIVPNLARQMSCSVKHDFEIRPDSGANFATGISIIGWSRPPRSDFHAFEPGVLDFDRHFSLSAVRNSCLVIQRIVSCVVARPDTGDIDANAVLGPAEQLVNWPSCDFADGVPESMLQTSPFHKPRLQVVFNSEKILSDQRRPDDSLQQLR